MARKLEPFFWVFQENTDLKPQPQIYKAKPTTTPSPDPPNSIQPKIENKNHNPDPRIEPSCIIPNMT